MPAGVLARQPAGPSIQCVIFTNRTDAGRRLAAQLSRFRNEDPVVLALPRGGVPVAFEIASALEAPLDVMVARKLGAPDQPEFAIGAIAPGATLLNEPAIQQLGISQQEIDQAIASETREMARRTEVFRRGRPPLPLQGKTVILVDDGLATGSTAAAAITSIRQQQPAHIVLAVPVCASDTAAAMRRRADEVITLATPNDFRAVSLWYYDFDQTTDEEVIALLDRSAATREGKRSS